VTFSYYLNSGGPGQGQLACYETIPQEIFSVCESSKEKKDRETFAVHNGEFYRIQVAVWVFSGAWGFEGSVGGTTTAQRKKWWGWSNDVTTENIEVDLDGEFFLEANNDCNLYELISHSSSDSGQNSLDHLREFTEIEKRKPLYFTSSHRFETDGKLFEYNINNGILVLD
jgi:hypothetical protein